MGCIWYALDICIQSTFRPSVPRGTQLYLHDDTTKLRTILSKTLLTLDAIVVSLPFATFVTTRRIEGSPNFRRIPLDLGTFTVTQYGKKGVTEYVCGSGMPTAEGYVFQDSHILRIDKLILHMLSYVLFGQYAQCYNFMCLMKRLALCTWRDVGPSIGSSFSRWVFWTLQTSKSFSTSRRRSGWEQYCLLDVVERGTCSILERKTSCAEASGPALTEYGVSAFVFHVYIPLAHIENRYFIWDPKTHE
jgi:hypothetical protein